MRPLGPPSPAPVAQLASPIEATVVRTTTLEPYGLTPSRAVQPHPTMSDTCTGILDWHSPNECRLRQFNNGLIVDEGDPLVPAESRIAV